MKIKANIPVEKVAVGPGMYTFRHEVVEVEVLRVIRYPVTRYRHLNRWHYMADIRVPGRMHPEAPRLLADGLTRVNIRRSGAHGLNPKWVPPVFPDGQDWVDVAG